VPLARADGGQRWDVLLTTEDAAFAPDAYPAVLDVGRPAVTFERPGAVVFRSETITDGGKG